MECVRSVLDSGEVKGTSDATIINGTTEKLKEVTETCRVRHEETTEIIKTTR